MLEDLNMCAVCEATVRGFVGGVPVYLCPHCYAEWGTPFMEKVPWAAYLLGREKARRKRRNRLLRSVGLPVFIYGVPHSWEAGLPTFTRLSPFVQLEAPDYGG